jgi:3-hydroxyisobutyrate dehydrogenase-like beta-hydroxyacid dehydrogenase
MDKFMLKQMTDRELSKENTTLGIIGLGLMGRRFLSRLNAEGWNVRGWNRSKSVTIPLTKYGFQVESTLAGLIQCSEVLLSSLADDSAVEAVYLSGDGVFSHVRPQTIILEMSTISPRLSAILHREAAKRGVHLIDLAVSGSTQAVEAGAVTLFGGGDRETFSSCFPIFQSISKQATKGVQGFTPVAAF